MTTFNTIKRCAYSGLIYGAGTLVSAGILHISVPAVAIHQTISTLAIVILGKGFSEGLRQWGMSRGLVTIRDVDKTFKWVYRSTLLISDLAVMFIAPYVGLKQLGVRSPELINALIKSIAAQTIAYTPIITACDLIVQCL